MLLYESSHATVLWDEATDSVVIRKKNDVTDETVHTELTNTLLSTPATDTVPTENEWGGIFQTTTALKTTSL
jgi:hypothetical protein